MRTAGLCSAKSPASRARTEPPAAGGVTRAGWLLSAAVLSHWLLDGRYPGMVSHRPDMPLAPGIGLTFGLFGLGLWNSIPATLIIEGGFWFLAVTLYVRAALP